ncbi:MAG TPA: hypothetical protein VND62_05985 [Acidimicrobiales bacterium]|nr:hypothetical protein [Acidimicrobiales bacterium]
MACPVPLNLVCGAVGGATSSIAGGVLSAVAGWVIQGATWLLNALGHAIASTTTVDVHASWFLAHYRVMAAIAGVVAVPMLVLAAVQALYHQNSGVLVRAAFVHLPLAGVLTAVAVQLVQLSLAATDALCTAVTNGTGGELDKTFTSIGTVLSHQLTPLPTFVMTVGALLIVSGAFALWLELLVRSAAIYAAVLFLPLALASLVWPAVSHWCRRLVEMLAALVLSKFVVVAVLSLAVGAVSAGGGFSTVLAGGALLLLAAFTPFTLLRLVPIAEVGAAAQLEGARQRVRGAVGRAPDSAVAFALRQGREHGAHRETVPQPLTPGVPGTGTTTDPGVPGSGTPGPSGVPGPLGAPGSGAPRRSPTEAAAALTGAAAASGLAAGADAYEVLHGAGSAIGTTPGQLPLGPVPREWLPSGDLTIPPGTIPVWEGSPESVIEAIEDMKQPRRVEPDGYGGIIPGVASPLWGGTEPFSRFEPGPKDDWGPREEWGTWDQLTEWGASGPVAGGASAGVGHEVPADGPAPTDADRGERGGPGNG